MVVVLCFLCFATIQVSGAGASERAHKEMNFVRSKARNRMAPERMEDLVYVRHNLLQVEKVQSLSHGGASTIAWTEGVEAIEDEEDVWEDAWQEARDEEDSQFAASRAQRISKSKSRSRAIKAAYNKRIPPGATDTTSTYGQAAEVAASAASATASRSGRTIRRPALLDI